MNSAQTPWYRAVPSILIVAPRGRTKLEMLLETPISSRDAFMVAGSEPELLVVVNATAAGFSSPFM